MASHIVLNFSLNQLGFSDILNEKTENYIYI